MATLSAAELVEWQMMEEFDPIGYQRLDLLAGVIAATVANQWRDKESKPLAPADLIPDWGGLRAEEERRTAHERSWTREDAEAWAEDVRLIEEGAAGG